MIASAEPALLLAAVLCHRADMDAERARFFGAAARGRPELGTPADRITLRLQGQTYRFRVLDLGPEEHLLEVDDLRLPVRVTGHGSTRHLEPLGVNAWVRPDERDGSWLVEIGARPVRVVRDDGRAVTAPAPAVVIATRVEPGQIVAEGDPLVVLEAMKMETTVAAPIPGRVRSVAASVGMQVGTGTPLVRLDPLREEGGPVGPRVAFGAMPLEPEPRPVDGGLGAGPCRRVLGDLRRLVLGYDVDPASATSLGLDWRSACAAACACERELCREEDGILSILADVVSLDGPFPEDDGKPAGTDLINYLRTLDAGQESLAPSFVATLRRGLAHHGVRTLERSPALEEAVWRLYRAWHDLDRIAPAVTAILERRIEGPALDAEDALRDVLDRITKALRRRDPRLADLARELRFRAFDQPLIERGRASLHAQADAHLDALTEARTAQARSPHLVALIDHPEPLKDLVLARLHRAGAGGLPLLEALARRYYRIRALGAVRTRLVGRWPVAIAEYPHDGTRIRLVAAFAERAELAELLRRLAPLVESTPDEMDVVLDLYLWRSEDVGDPDLVASELRDQLDAAAFGRTIRRVVVALAGPDSGPSTAAAEHVTFRPGPGGHREERLYRGLHPMIAKRLDLWRLSNFDLIQVASEPDVHLFHGVARENPKDERLFAIGEVRDLTPVRDEEGRVRALPQLEDVLTRALESMRVVQAHRPAGRRLLWNRVLIYVWPPVTIPPEELFGIVRRLAPTAEGLGLEKVVVRGRMPDPASGALRERVLHIATTAGTGLVLRFGDPADRPVRPLSEYQRKVVQARQRGATYPYELVAMMTPSPGEPSEFPPGRFEELDLDDHGRLVPVDRPPGGNEAGVVVGLITNATTAHPEGMTRVIVLGDPTKALGSLAEPECRRIAAALVLAATRKLPLEWVALSAGARIAKDSGTENMDWIGLVLRRLIEFTQAGGEVNVIVAGINVGAQPYWNAEATMLMHTKGILVMTPDSAMVLTGKQALDYSGGVSADDNHGIGGYDRVMGPNGQAQYWAPDLVAACLLLLRHYEHTYVAPGERSPRRVATADPIDRDVRVSPHRDGWGFATVGEIWSDASNPERKRPFDIRSVMSAVVDADLEPLERWHGMRDAEIAVVWDAHLGGYSVCLIGLESHPLPRRGPAPADGPEHWTSGTLFPQASKKVARAINAASGNRPVVVLANLAGFDGSPESMRSLQLEYGAEIGRAVVNFEGPMVFVVVSRYHGGAFVVFSQTLNERLEIAAIEGSYASVIGGAPAAAVVFAREVDERTGADLRVAAIRRRLEEAESAARGGLRSELQAVTARVHSEKVSELAREFDAIHSIERALRVGSVHRIIEARSLRPYLVDAIERGMRRSGGHLVVLEEAS